MWATHRGLSKPCANRASCPSRALSSGGSERCQGVPVGLDLHVQEIAEQDWLLAVRAGTAQPQDSAIMIALGASSLAEVTYVALRAFIDGVCHECGSLAERLSKDLWGGKTSREHRSAMLTMCSNFSGSCSQPCKPWCAHAT